MDIHKIIKPFQWVNVDPPNAIPIRAFFLAQRDNPRQVRIYAPATAFPPKRAIFY
jgi:hypothetical protein